MKRAQLRESTRWVCSVSLNLMFGPEHQISNAMVSATKGAHEASVRVES
jgi:hypothetical protein